MLEYNTVVPDPCCMDCDPCCMDSCCALVITPRAHAQQGVM